MFESHRQAFSRQRFLTPQQIAQVQDKLSEMVVRGQMQVEFMKKYERELELWGEQRKLNPGSETDRVALDRIGKLLKEERLWWEAWEAGRIAPPPREVKQ